MRQALGKLVVSIVAAAATACTSGGSGDSAGGSTRPTGAVVDSTIPRDQALRRFRSGLEPVKGLAGPASRDSLVARFVQAVSRHDTASMRALALDRREFAYLFYPATPQGLPPYDLSPQLMWDLLTRQSERGVSDVLRRLGGRDLSLVTHDCGTAPAPEGENNVWGPCTVTLAVEGHDTITARLTGPILERAGRYKFISYTSELD